MGGLFDLPDISEEDWLSYSADTFRRQTQPLADSALFMQQTAAPTRSAIEQLANLSTAPPVQTPPPPPPSPQPMQMQMQAPQMPDLFGGQMGDQGLFGRDGAGGQVEPSSLLSTLGQYPDDDDEIMGPPGPQEVSPGVPRGGGDQPGFWSGIAPGKPNVFSWAGTQLGNLADAARGNPFLQSGQGQLATGITRGLSGVAHELGGSAEALRQGDIAGGIGGTLKAATSPGDVFRTAAKEMNVPNQIFPGISPETPVIGGLNNPQELAGLVPELLLPNTALENIAGRAIGAAARPIMRGAREAAGRIGEVASPYVDQALSAGKRWATDAPLGIESGGRVGRSTYSADRFGIDSLYHETSADNAASFVRPAGGLPTHPSGTWVSPDPDLALGQGASRGVTIEFGDTARIDAVPARNKPLAAAVEEAQGAPPELRVTAFRGGDELVRSMTIDPSVTDPRSANILSRRLQNSGWTPTDLGDGRVRWDNPGFRDSRTTGGSLDGIASRMMESPFFSPARTGGELGTDLALGTAGAVAGAATAPEDATWQERAGRAAVLGGLAAMGGPIARAPKGVSGLLREFARNEDGSLNLGAVQRGRLDPPEGTAPETWRSMSRNERRRTNFKLRRGEYANRAVRAGQGEVPDYGMAPSARVTPDEVPDAAQDEIYDRTYERLSERGLPEDEVDETAYEVSRQAREEAEEEIVAQAPTLWDDHPELRPTEAADTGRWADEREALDAHRGISSEIIELQKQVQAQGRYADPYDVERLAALKGEQRKIGAEIDAMRVAGSGQPSVTASDEVARLTADVPTAMPYSKPAVAKQEQFIGAQTGLPGIAGTEYRASTGRIAEETYDPETGRFQGFGETVGASDPQSVTQALIAEMATRTGSTPVGTVAAQTLRQFSGESLATLLDPLEATLLPEVRSSVQRAIGRGGGELTNELPEVQDYADRMTALAQEELLTAHGGRSDAELQVAVENLSKYALDIARSVETRSGLTSDVLVATLHRAVAATTTPAYLAYDRMRMALRNGLDPNSAEFAKLETDYKRIATVNAIYKAGLESVASAAGRALRANREDVYNAGLDERPRGFIPRVAGATVDSGDEARSLLFGNAPTAATAREQGQKAWNARLRAIRKGQDVEAVGPSSGQTWDSEYWQEIRKREIAAKPAGTAAMTGSGRRVGGPLEREGLLWSDLFVRDDPSFPKGTKLTEEERMRWLFGLEEVGSGKDRALLDKFYDRMIDINPDDRDAVMKFWADAAREGGYNTTKVPALVTNKKGQVVRGFAQVTQTEVPWERGHDEAGSLTAKRGPDWNQYKKTAETMTRDEALKLTERTLKSRLEKATTALERATAQKDAGLIKRYTQEVSAAEKELSGDQGLMARMERLYPPQIEGQSDRLQGEILRITRQANRMPDGPEKQGLLDQVQTLEAERGAAWQRQQYRPGVSTGFYDDPATLIRKAELLKELDTVGRGTQAVRAGLSVVTSNMLTSARMVEMSTLESALMMANRLYTQAVWRSDPEGAKQLAQGMWAGATPAWANFVRVMKTGSGPMEAMNLLKDLSTKGAPAARSDSMRGAVGWLAPMHRISRGIQEFFTTVAYYGELNRLAHVEAQKAIDANEASRGVGAASRGRIYAGGPTEIRGTQPEFFPEMYMANPTEEMRDEALETALTIASGGPHSWVSKQIAAMKSSLERSDVTGGKAFGAVMNVLYPFVYGIDFTIRTSLKVGAGPVMYPIKAARALKEGDRGAARAYGMAAAITSSIDMFLFHQITQGNITGKGPSDPAERQALLETTDENGDPAWRPDSMRVPLPGGRHIWMNYGSLPGIGVLAGVMSNMYDAYVWDGKQNDTSAEVFGRLAVSMMEGVAEGTFFRDTLDVASILTEPQSASTAASRFGAGLVGRAIPAAVRQVAQFSDPYRKAPEGFGQELMQNVPGLRGMVPNQVSPFTGEDVRMGYNPATLLAPGTIYSGDGRPNPLANEVSGLQERGLRVGPTNYSATQQGRGATLMGQRQTGAAVRGAQGELAEEGNAAALRLINSPQYQQMTPEQKAANLEAVFSTAQDRARYEVQGNLQLSPAQQLTRAEMAIPRYEGVSGTPEQIARRNHEISTAKAALANYQKMYGEDMGEMMLYRQDRNAWRDAVLYEDMDKDIRWLRSQQAARGLGLNPAALGQPGAPGELPAPYLGSQFFSGTNTPNIFPQPEQSYANRLPPGLR